MAEEEEDSHGVDGLVKIGQSTHDINQHFWGEAPVRVEITENGEHRNLLVLDADIVLTARDDGSVTLNLSMEDAEAVSHEDWQEGNHSALEDE